MGERVLGRVAADDVIVVPGTGEVIVAKGELIDERRADLINARAWRRSASAAR